VSQYNLEEVHIENNTPNVGEAPAARLIPFCAIAVIEKIFDDDNPQGNC